MNPTWILRTARLVLTPVGGADLPDLRAIKADPRVFAVMLGGVRSAVQSARGTGRGRRRLGRQRLRHVGDPRIGGHRRARGRLCRNHRSGTAAGRPGRRAALRAMARGAGARPGARGGRRRSALRSRAGGAAAHRRGGAGEQFRLAHGARRHRHDRMRRLHAARLPHGDVRERRYQSVAIPPGPPAGAWR